VALPPLPTRCQRHRRAAAVAAGAALLPRPPPHPPLLLRCCCRHTEIRLPPLPQSRRAACLTIAFVFIVVNVAFIVAISNAVAADALS
jgi:hypothetical protein